MPRPHPTVIPYEPDESFVNVGYFTWLHQRKAWREKAPRSKGQRYVCTMEVACVSGVGNPGKLAG